MTAGMRRAAFVVAICALAGCGRYYYGGRPGATAEQFHQESLACMHEAGRTIGAGAPSSAVQGIYRACLQARGWTRDKQYHPVPEGWYRGIE